MKKTEMVFAWPRIISQNSNQRSAQLQSIHHRREQNRAQQQTQKEFFNILIFLFIFCFHFHTIISHSHSHSLHKVRSFPEITVLFAPSRLSIQTPNETINALFDCLFSSYFCVCAYFHHISSSLLILSSSDAVVWCVAVVSTSRPQEDCKRICDIHSSAAPLRLRHFMSSSRYHFSRKRRTAHFASPPTHHIKWRSNYFRYR